MKPSSQNQYTAWIDGLLSPEESAQFEAAFSPEALATAQQDRIDVGELGNLLRTHLKAPAMKNADFFTHAILQEIASEAKESHAAAVDSRTHLHTTHTAPENQRHRHEDDAGFHFSWTLLWHFLSASSVCAAIATLCAIALLGTPGSGSDDYYAEFVNPKPGKGISADSFHSPEENITVLWLDGLDYVPATALNTHVPHVSGGGRR